MSFFVIIIDNREIKVKTLPYELVNYGTVKSNSVSYGLLRKLFDNLNQ